MHISYYHNYYKKSMDNRGRIAKKAMYAIIQTRFNERFLLTNSDLPKWKTTNSEYLVKDRWISLRADSCVTPTGAVIEPYYVLEYGDWANCFVIDEKLDVLMVQNYRQGIGEYVTEFVSGGIETDDGSVIEGMKRELEEEIGYTGGQVHQVGVSYTNPGNQNNKLHSFFAFGGAITKDHQREAGETMVTLRLPLREAVAMLRDTTSGACYQSFHLTTLSMALNFIRQSDLAELQEIKDALGEERW
jgi:8-oxo-dGTP pyrophosphatase MutT (NUDIX family)